MYQPDEMRENEMGTLGPQSMREYAAEVAAENFRQEELQRQRAREAEARAAASRAAAARAANGG